MQNDLKKTIEMAVLNDIQYILNYKPIAVEAQSAKHFSKMTIIKPIAINVYPQIYVDLIGRFDLNEATRRLRNLGLRETKFLYATFPEMLKQKRSFTGIFKEMAKVHLDSELLFKDKVTENKKLKSCTIVVKNCFFCSEITPFENIEIPYCTPNAALFENAYNIKSLYIEDMEPRLIHIKAVKSAEYDGDTCEYRLLVLD